VLGMKFRSFDEALSGVAAQYLELCGAENA
jgi:hypothetical protein